MQEEHSCKSCGIRLLGPGTVTFKCPECGNATISRCPQCRDQSVKYTCPACGVQGP
ncbi:MAG TPA: DUF1610 domain-containing protein [Euryarchaeota archaeon]|nr:DUF1610 domain-containing protein [Euryarchaeota archaeon]